MKKTIKLPVIKNEDQERIYWAKFDLSKHANSEDFENVIFPNLKPTTRSISIRMPEWLIDRVKELVNEIHVPYQPLIKQYIREGVSSSG